MISRNTPKSAHLFQLFVRPDFVHWKLRGVCFLLLIFVFFRGTDRREGRRCRVSTSTLVRTSFRAFLWSISGDHESVFFPGLNHVRSVLWFYHFLSTDGCHWTPASTIKCWCLLCWYQIKSLAESRIYFLSRPLVAALEGLSEIEEAFCSSFPSWFSAVAVRES